MLKKTERFALRYVEAADAARLSDLMTPDISAWLANWPVPFTPAMAAERIEAVLQAAGCGDAAPFVILSNDGVIGWMLVMRDDKRRHAAHLSFWLGYMFWHSGVLRECLPAAIAAGFETLGVDAIEGGAQLTNVASLAVMRRAGMKPIGTRNIYAVARSRTEICAFFEIRKAG